VKPHGTLKVTGVGQAILDLEGVKIPLSGEVSFEGHKKQGTITVQIPNELVGVLTRMLAHPMEQIPMYREGLVGLHIRRA
jgi:hypothetical protein